MKNIKSYIKILVASFALMQTTIGQTGPKQDCTIAPSYIAHSGLSVSSVKSGKPFTLSLSVPGPSTCNYEITIQTSSNLLYVPTASYPLPLVITSTVPPIYKVYMPGTGNSNPDYTFKFKPGETCNGEVGTFTIKIKRICGTTADSCETKLQLTAEAQNYWGVKKEHVWGDMRGGTHVWRVRLEQTPHLYGEGDYNIYAGTIKDVISTGASTVITSVSVPATGLGSNTAIWNTGTISSGNSYVDYYVYSTSCEAVNTLITNCVNYDFCLGKEISAIKTQSAKLLPPGAGSSGPSIPIIDCCDKLKGSVCNSFKLADANLVTSPLSKGHLFATTSNYTTGCEGVYQIVISNPANVPIGNLDLTDNFPAISQIKATSISITSSTPYGTAPALSYDLFIPSSNLISTYSGNTNVSYSSPLSAPFTPSFAGFRFKTTAGSLTFGSIIITVRFTITGSVGASITNCANLKYDGIFSATSSNCGVTVPPVTSGNVNACDVFVVQPPKAIPFITKCITGGTNSFQIGDEIPFRIVIANHGAGNFTANLNDLLEGTGTLQHLELVTTSPVTYSWGVAAFNPYSAPYIDCYPAGLGAGLPSFITPNLADIHNPQWSINNMPGNCDLNKAEYVVIEFKAKVKPTGWGPYYNIATLSYLGGPSTATALYNIIAIGDIKPVKLVNGAPGNAFTGATAFVDPGNPFQFSLRFLNDGSVNIKNLNLKDAMPSCATSVSILSCTVYPGDGSASYAIGTSGSLANLTFIPTTFILKPGDLVEVIVNATAAANYTTQCCNNGFKIEGDNLLSGLHIENQSDQACIKPLNCCNIQQTSVTIIPQASSFNDWLNFNVAISAGSLPIQEVTIALVDYHVEYNLPDCKPLNIGDGVTNMKSLASGMPFNIGGTVGLLQMPALQSPITIQNQINWALGNPILFTPARNVPISILRPDVLNIPCCNGTFYYCLKVTIKDVNCNICEKVICSSAPLYKQTTHDVLDVQKRLYMTTQKGKEEQTGTCQNCEKN